MKEISTELLSLLNTSCNLVGADLYKIQINDIDNTILRYTNFDIDLTYNGEKYLSNRIIFERDGFKNEIQSGGELTIDVYSDKSDLLEGGITFFQALMIGYFDNSTIELRKAYISNETDIIGAILLFSGFVECPQLNRNSATIKVKSKINKLNNKLPINILMPSCIHSLYDDGCKVNRTLFSTSGLLLSGGNQTTLKTNIINVDEYYNRGVIVFTSGLNNGIFTTIKNYKSTGEVYLSCPLPFGISNGDEFVIYPGCDKTKEMCINKYNNFLRNRSYKYVPKSDIVNP